MKCINSELIKSLQSKNIILLNGFLNTRYKIMLEKHFPEVFSNITKSIFPELRQALFHLCFDFEIVNCKTCGSQMINNFNKCNFLYPQYPYMTYCSSKCQNFCISENMKKLSNDPSWQENRIKKFKETVSIIQESGLSRASEIAFLAANTKRNTFVDGKSLLEIQREKSLITRIKNNKCIDPMTRSEFYQYRKRVHQVSKKQPIEVLDFFSYRGHYNTNGYHLDHIFSIFDGHKLKIPDYVIGNIVNLRFIPALENTIKSGRSDMMLTILLNRYYEYNFLNIPLSDLTPF